MWALIPSWLKIAVGGVLLVLATSSASYLIGKGAGRQEAAVASLSKSVEVLRERNVIDETVSSSTAADMCRSYGLPDSDIPECMRRVGEADANARDGR